MAVARAELDAYFQKYRVHELLKDLTEDLALHRPPDPQRHLLDRLIGLTENSADRVRAVTPRPPEGVAFLRVNVECKTKGGTCMRLFTKNGALESTPPRTVLAWKMAAEAEIASVVSEALGVGGVAPDKADAAEVTEVAAPPTVASGDGESAREVTVLREEIKKLQTLIHELEVKLHDTQVSADFASINNAQNNSQTASRRRRASHSHAIRPDADFKRRPSAGDADSRMPPELVMPTHMRSPRFPEQHKIGYKKDASAACDLPPVEGCTLRLIQVNDVYDLAHWPAFDSVVRHHSLPNTLTVLPGDFLAPSLLSSLDSGKGMVDIMNQVGGRGIEVVCFGNHEADVPYSELVKRIDEYQGCWLNSNLPDFKCNKELPPFKIIEVEGGGQKRRVGLIGLLTVDQNLYQAGAFGGAIATGQDVCSTAAALRKTLLEDHRCDLVIPLTHQVMADDRAMAALELGFPVIVGAHDHEPFLEHRNGAWITKAGQDAQNAVIIDIKWASKETPGEAPEVTVELVPVKTFPKSAALVETVKQHMRCVEEMEGAFLCSLDPLPGGERYSSAGMRQGQTTVGTMLACLIRDGLRASADDSRACDGVMVDAGAIRRGFLYPEAYPHFTYGDLKKELPFSSDIVVVTLAGAVVCAAVAFSRSKAALDPPEDWGGYLQVDDGIEWDPALQAVTKIGGEAVAPARPYRIACLLLSLQGMNRNQALIDWADANPARVPDDDMARPAKDIIVACCAARVWAQLPSFQLLDADADGKLSVGEVQEAMARAVGKHVSRVDAEKLVAAIDTDNDGTITAAELEQATRSPLARARPTGPAAGGPLTFGAP